MQCNDVMTATLFGPTDPFTVAWLARAHFPCSTGPVKAGQFARRLTLQLHSDLYRCHLSFIVKVKLDEIWSTLQGAQQVLKQEVSGISSMESAQVAGKCRAHLGAPYTPCIDSQFGVSLLIVVMASAASTSVSDRLSQESLLLKLFPASLTSCSST